MLVLQFALKCELGAEHLIDGAAQQVEKLVREQMARNWLARRGTGYCVGSVADAHDAKEFLAAHFVRKSHRVESRNSTSICKQQFGAVLLSRRRNGRVVQQLKEFLQKRGYRGRLELHNTGHVEELFGCVENLPMGDKTLQTVEIAPRVQNL